MSQIVITGANRGIGLALTRLYSAQGHQVLSACRQSSEALQKTQTEIYAGLELTSDASVKALGDYLGERKIDILIENAGILKTETWGNLDFAAIREQFEVNALAPLRLTQALSANLKEGSKVVLITSRMGSLGDNSSGAYYGYRMSKAALNMAGINLAKDLQPRGIAVFIIHPGMVATEMTGGQGIAVEKAAEMLVKRIEVLTLRDSGGFFHANGEILPW